MEKIVKIVAFIVVLLGINVFVFSLLKTTGHTQNKTAKFSSSTPKPENKVTLPQVSLKSVFEGTEPKLGNLDQSKIVTLMATGDVIPARGAGWPAVTKNDFNYNWRKTADFLKTADITLINLEAPLVKGCPLVSSGFKFCADARQVEGMLYAGVDVANLMNNHIDNYGAAAVTETEKTLDENHIIWSGFSNLAIKEIKGKKFGFLGYNGIGVVFDREAVATEIKESKPKVDVLVISVHWGKEYESIPLTDGNIAPDNPIEIGHLMIDSGADLIIGNHPHWVQGVEIYKGKFIAYAHGNFIFDQTWSIETQEGVIGSYTFYDGQLIAANYKPIVVDKSYQPDFAPATRAKTILQRMIDSSNEIAKINHS